MENFTNSALTYLSLPKKSAMDQIHRLKTWVTFKVDPQSQVVNEVVFAHIVGPHLLELPRFQVTGRKLNVGWFLVSVVKVMSIFGEDWTYRNIQTWCLHHSSNANNPQYVLNSIFTFFKQYETFSSKGNDIMIIHVVYVDVIIFICIYIYIWYIYM